MLDAFFTMEMDDKDYPDHTGIEWLDQALLLAGVLIKAAIEHGRLAESGKAIVLKTIERESVQEFESSTYRHKRKGS